MVRTSVTHSAEPRVPLFCPFVHFDVICDLSLNRRTATWNLFVKKTRYPLHINLIFSFSDRGTICLFSFKKQPGSFWGQTDYGI